jgi:hypothetical protein
MNVLRRFVGLAILASANLLLFQHLVAQLPTPSATVIPQPQLLTAPYLAVSYSSGQSITVPINDGISTLVCVQPDQLVQLTVQYPTSQALQTVNLQSLDGGAVLPTTTTAGADGTLNFTFQVGHTPGVYQVALNGGGEELGLQFWVLDQQSGAANPPCATANNPNY